MCRLCSVKILLIVVLLFQVPGFPSKFENQKTLEEFIVNFYWINILHVSCNYALAPDFVPTSSPKLYDAIPGTPALKPDQVFMNGFWNAVSCYKVFVKVYRVIHIKIKKSNWILRDDAT